MYEMNFKNLIYKNKHEIMKTYKLIYIFIAILLIGLSTYLSQYNEIFETIAKIQFTLLGLFILFLFANGIKNMYFNKKK
jgi:hypothetical protein